MTAILWAVGGFLAWLALAVIPAVVIGKAIHTADARCCPHETDVPRLRKAGQ